MCSIAWALWKNSSRLAAANRASARSIARRPASCFAREINSWPRSAASWAERPTTEASQADAFLKSLLTAFPDRLAKRRDSSGGKGVMVGGRGVRLAPQCAVTGAELFLCIDVDAGQTEAIVRQASAVERDWLPADELRTVDEVFFHPTQKAVVARRRTYWLDLVIEEVNVPVTLGENSAAVLAEAAWREWDRVFPADEPALTGFLTRVRCLAGWMPELNLPTFDEAQLKALLAEFAMSCRSFDELRRAPWLDLLKDRLTYAQRQAVDREAPERLTVPSGSQIALTYEPGRPPVLPVRIQEVFGLRETPRIAGGRVARRPASLSPQHADAADHGRPGKLLGQRLSASPQGSARPLSEAFLARRPVDCRTYAPHEKTQAVGQAASLPFPMPSAIKSGRHRITCGGF